MVFLVLDSKRYLLETPLLFGMRALFWIVVTYLLTHTPLVTTVLCFLQVQYAQARSYQETSVFILA